MYMYIANIIEEELCIRHVQSIPEGRIKKIIFSRSIWYKVQLANTHITYYVYNDTLIPLNID